MADGKYRRLDCSSCFSAFTQTGVGRTRSRCQGCVELAPKRVPAVRGCATQGCSGLIEAVANRKYCATCSALRLKWGVVCTHAKPLLKNGRPRARCYVCSPAPEAKPRRMASARHQLTCKKCSAGFVAKLANAKYCSAKCRSDASNAGASAAVKKQCVGCKAPIFMAKGVKRTWCNLECKPKALRGLFSCQQCGADSRKGGGVGRFCSTRCAGAYRADRRAPEFCAYHAGYCKTCGGAHGQRREWSECPPCARAAASAAAREASRATFEAKHKAAGKVVACDECGGQFCPLYSKKTGAVALCMVCSRIRRARVKRQQSGNSATRAKRYGAPRRHFNEVKRVLERDGWRCQICGVATPKRLRGTCDPKAPEVDHVIPLSAPDTPGHVPENCQCACRACNGAKGAKPLGQLSLAL